MRKVIFILEALANISAVFSLKCFNEPYREIALRIHFGHVLFYLSLTAMLPGG